MKKIWSKETKFALVVFLLILGAEYLDHSQYRLELASRPTIDGGVCDKRPAYCWLQDKKSR